MINEKNIGYWMSLAIIFLLLIFFIGLVWFRVSAGVVYLAVHAPVFLYFNRKAIKLPTASRVRHGVNVTLATLTVMLFEVLFTLPIIGVYYGIKLLVR